MSLRDTFMYANRNSPPKIGGRGGGIFRMEPEPFGSGGSGDCGVVVWMVRHFRNVFDVLK